MQPGDRLAHYEIRAPLGTGGMGEVYRARDLTLERDVAIKVLPAEVAAHPDRLERFRREARAVAALSHPNIVMVHSVEECDGVHFLTMELITGRVLSRLIPAAGMSPAALLDIAVPLADAVAAAHEHGIVHRDLKPANVMVGADDRVKVLDFGLAKRAAPADDLEATAMPTEAWMTQEGRVVGTVPYMSPEQIEARPVDHRTDVFSLGVMLFEMATGRRPFQGDTSPALMASILKDEPPVVTEINAALPRELGRVIGRCLEKRVRDRYQTARDVYNELRLLHADIQAGRVAGAREESEATLGGASRSTPSLVSASDLQVAVLPFTERTGDPDLTALAEGIAESVVAGLSRFSYMNVVSAEASFALHGQAPDAVAAQLGARYVLDGSVRRAGATTRFSARLTDTTNGSHLWAERYDRDLTGADLFAVQDEIAARISATTCDLSGVLPRVIGALLKAKPPEALTPYEAVLRKFNYYYELSASEHEQVRAILERAVQQDPRSADAWAALSMMYAEEHKHGFNVRPAPLQRALEAARRATVIDGANHLARHALAQAHFFRKEFDPFRVAARRAIELNPWDAVTVAYMGILLGYAGDWDEAVRLTRGAGELNPHHPGWFVFAEIWSHYRKREWQQALDAAQRLNMPHYFYQPLTLALCYARLGRMEEARQAIDELLAMAPNFAEVAEEELRKWQSDDLATLTLEGLRMAGLEAPGP